LQTATHLQAAEGFVPLSDVPDVVWKTNINRGKPEVARAQENWNHYADIDLPGGDGKTLAEMYTKVPASLQPSVWLKFYDDARLPSAAKKQTGKNNLGALPFRVWQIFAQMLEYATTDLERFVTAAGVLAHYVGDACQPLHSSQHSDGLNGASTGVHSTYEDNMVDAKAPEIAAGLEVALKSLDYKPRTMRNPRDAAMAVMDLMLFAQKTLPPKTICEVYSKANPNATHASKNAAVIDALWDGCGEQTIEVIAAGAVTLGALWQAAWTISGADASSLPATAFTDQQAIIDIYEGKGFSNIAPSPLPRAEGSSGIGCAGEPAAASSAEDRGEEGEKKGSEENCQESRKKVCEETRKKSKKEGRKEDGSVAIVSNLVPDIHTVLAYVVQTLNNAPFPCEPQAYAPLPSPPSAANADGFLRAT
jgi:hypothetical protein